MRYLFYFPVNVIVIIVAICLLIICEILYFIWAFELTTKVLGNEQTILSTFFRYCWGRRKYLFSGFIIEEEFVI